MLLFTAQVPPQRAILRLFFALMQIHLYIARTGDLEGHKGNDGRFYVVGAFFL
jgi:hypothetical protein